MRNQRTFSLEFKRQVVEELMSGERGARPALSQIQYLLQPVLSLERAVSWGQIQR